MKDAVNNFFFQDEIILRNSEYESKPKLPEIKKVEYLFNHNSTKENVISKSDGNCIAEFSLEKAQQTGIPIGCKSISSTIIIPINDNLHKITVEKNIIDKHISLHGNSYNSNYVYRNSQSFKQNLLAFEEIFQEKDLLGKIIQKFEIEMDFLKQKKSRAWELEKQIESFCKEKFIKNEELNMIRQKLSATENELFNQKVQTNNFKCKIACLEKEIEKLKNICCEKEKLRIDNTNLLKLLEEHRALRDDNEKLKMKHLKELKDEQDIWNRKYRNLKELKSECDLLRLKVKRAQIIEYQRNVLEKQVQELETCISEQEKEIHRLLRHIDHLVDVQYSVKLENTLKEGS